MPSGAIALTVSSLAGRGTSWSGSDDDHYLALPATCIVKDIKSTLPP
jgi:hypothetical protein